ncbi:MazG nucleotide pyrophosphohydrolase domain-containing protein [Microbacteriaceae bacterium 4G12]
MDLVTFEQWVENFYVKRGWSQYGPFIRVNFLLEETGEVARVVRSLEIGRDRPDEATKNEEELKTELKEELGDVLSNLIILAKQYDLDLQDIMDAHTKKLSERFE